MRCDLHHTTMPTRCPICQSEHSFLNTGVNIADGFINKCRTCYGYFLFPPKPVNYTASGWTEFREARWQEDIRIAQTLAPRIIGCIGKFLHRPIKNVLEIGCGSGFMGVGFRSAGCNYVGIDVDSAAIEFARAKDINAHCTDLQDAIRHPAIHQSFDLIISSNVFEHFTDPLKEFQNLRTIMHNAIIVIIVPNATGLFAVLKSNKLLASMSRYVLNSDRNIVYSIDGYWHNISYSRKTLLQLANMANIEVINVGAISNNDSVFGFVQPNTKLLYRLASSFAAMLDMDSQLLLIGKLNT